ncbi:MAG: VOC family protein [Sandaracinaceae bacterium]|nr:VOC family protein [Sandaracinaceae bacterium]
MSKFVHMELNTSDAKGAKAFYKGVFGWKIQDMKMPEGVYSMIASAQGEGIGGIQQNPSPDMPPAWLGYVGVESIAKTIKKIEKRGGKVVHQGDVPGMGKLAIFLDPQNVACALWEPAPPAAPEKKASKKKAAKKKAAKKKAAKKADKKK